MQQHTCHNNGKQNKKVENEVKRKQKSFLVATQNLLTVSTLDSYSVNTQKNFRHEEMFEKETK